MRGKPVLIATLLAIATVAAYFSVVTCGFISFDDKGYVYNNPHVRQGISWQGWCYAWTTFDCGNWHPLTWLSLELDSTLWGINPSGYHATNLLLHTINVILLFLVLYRMTAHIRRSGIVAAVFALHPLHVESVAWIAERKDVLCTFFLLLTLLFYVRFAGNPTAGRYMAVVLMFILGLLAKPMLVTLPILLLLIDWWPLGRISLGADSSASARFPRESALMLLFEKLPLFAIATLDGLATILAQRSSMGFLTDLTIDVRVCNMFYAYWWYLLKTFCPTGLTIFYPHPERELSWGQVLCGAVCVSLISGFAVWRCRSKPYVAMGWAWFVIALLPVIGLLQVGAQAYADRYVYIPHIGLFISIVWAIDSWLEDNRIRRWLCDPAIGAILLACGVLTHLQVSYWKDNKSLWTHTISCDPDNYVGHLHLAEVHWLESDYQGTIDHLSKALQYRRCVEHLKPDAYWIYGKSLIELGRPAEAEGKFLLALQTDEDHEKSLDELSKLLKTQNRPRELAQISSRHARALMRAVEEYPNDAETRFKLGLLLAQQGKIASAIVQFQKATQLAPESAAAYNNLAIALADGGRFREAKSTFARAIELDPTLANAHFYLAEILAMEQDFSAAKEHYAESMRLNPGDKEAEQRLNRLLNP